MVTGKAKVLQETVYVYPHTHSSFTHPADDDVANKQYKKWQTNVDVNTSSGSGKYLANVNCV